MKNKNAKRTATRIPTTVVARYVPLRKVTRARETNIIVINPQANPSSPSVILIAFTTAIVAINVRIGKRIPTSIFHAIGQRFIYETHNFT